MILVPPILVLAASGGVVVDAQPVSTDALGSAFARFDPIAYEPSAYEPSASAPSAYRPMFAAPAPVLGDDMPPLEYTYVELNYLWTDSGDLDEKVGGAELIGSLELPLNFFGQVTVSHQSNDADLNRFKIGAGYHFPVLSRFDLYGILSYVHSETNDAPEDVSGDGVSGELGARMLLTHKIEINAAAKWENVNDDVFTIGFGARYYFLEHFSVGGRVESIDGDASFALGARLEL